MDDDRTMNGQWMDDKEVMRKRGPLTGFWGWEQYAGCQYLVGWWRTNDVVDGREGEVNARASLRHKVA